MATYHIDKQQIRKRILVGFIFVGLVLGSVVALYFFRTLQTERDPVTANPVVADIRANEESGAVADSLFSDADEDVIDLQELRDNQRRENIDAIHAELQRYYQENNQYPSLANMNSTGFRQGVFPGLEDADFTDPENDDFSVTITRTPQPAVYSYEVVDENGYTCEPVGRQCVSYTLSALLSTELAYQLSSED
jgi:hypothetical protein